MVASFGFGGALLARPGAVDWSGDIWIYVKLALVALLAAFHGLLARWRPRLRRRPKPPQRTLLPPGERGADARDDRYCRPWSSSGRSEPAGSKRWVSEPGVLSSTAIAALIERSEVAADEPIGAAQIQPASLDLRLGPTAYRVRASFLPGRESVSAKIARLGMHEIDLTPGGRCWSAAASTSYR